MDFNFFENDIFFQIFNMNLNKMVWKKFLEDFFEDFLKNIF
jgi:hypothetical protein